jgi:methionyl-tRNA formyltransferase
MLQKNNLRIVFMGTPDFAVESLKKIIDAGFNVVAVVTAPDKPAGRGLKVQQSAVKIFAEQNGLSVLQPEKLKDSQFLFELKQLNADLQIVVAFRMLPEVVWQMPRLGTFNLHGSLLPQYRGASPINWAVINGEVETGVTTFFLKHEIDTGKIIFREKISILENDTAGTVHDKLMHIGAELVLKTVNAIEANSFEQIEQSNFINPNAELKHAPKIFKEDCKINFSKPKADVNNLIRGLSPYPGAFTTILSPDNKEYQLKIFNAKKTDTISETAMSTDGKNYLHINCCDGCIAILDLQMEGKKRMLVEDFLRGFKITNEWKLA